MKNEVVYTAGAYIEPVKIGEAWKWVIAGFEDEAFVNGTSANLAIEAEHRENLYENQAGG